MKKVYDCFFFCPFLIPKLSRRETCVPARRNKIKNTPETDGAQYEDFINIRRNKLIRGFVFIYNFMRQKFTIKANKSSFIRADKASMQCTRAEEKFSTINEFGAESLHIVFRKRIFSPS